MDIPFSRWYAAIFKRRSRRNFEQRPVESYLLSHLQKVCEEFRPFKQARSVLLTHSADEVFKGAIGHYGKVKGAPAFIAFIGDMDDPNIHEKVGHTGEAIILEATALNLDTCWVGGFFHPQVAATIVGAGENERVLAVTPIGHARKDWSLEEKIMTAFGRKHQRKPLTELVTGLEETKWTFWIRPSLEAARLAPSALNRQPWRFHVEPDSITISVDNLKNTFNISKRLDCGIAMLHIEVASLNSGVKGRWELLEPPKVGRFQQVGLLFF
ncbi:MAG: nitroreductase family protein [Nitrospirota bacterium]